MKYEQFLREYQIVREHQGWGRHDAAYFLALPEVAPDDPQGRIWHRRSASCRVLFEQIIGPMATLSERPLRILDLGAGNCWLAYRLTTMGHQVAAIDISLDTTDGLGAHEWYRPELERAKRTPFTVIQAEFEHIPLIDGAADVAVFNASLHYSFDCNVTLRDALRVLSPRGTVVVMDSPVYLHAGSGEQMVREREAGFERTHGFRSDSVPAENFLTVDRLESVAGDLGLRWKMYAPPTVSNRVKTRWRRLRGLRELARMPVISGSRV